MLWQALDADSDDTLVHRDKPITTLHDELEAEGEDLDIIYLDDDEIEEAEDLEDLEDLGLPRPS